MKNVTIDSLLKEMHGAEEKWRVEEVMETDFPLSYEELPTLRVGEKVTVVKWYSVLRDGAWVKEFDVFRAKVTRVRQRGYTDLRGFWSCEPQTPESAKYAVRLFLGKELGDELFPSWRICFKDITGLSLVYDVTELVKTKVYRGWSVQFEEESHGQV